MEDLETLATTATPAHADAELEARAEEVCGRLLIDRYLLKRDYRDLLLDDALRAVVARRLSGVGLQLVESFTSDYFAVRLKREVEADIAFDWATNSRLPRGAVALLVILWAKLVLPKRVQPSDAVEADAAAPKPPARVVVTRDALYAEFGRKFGKTAFARYLGQLKSAAFVREDRLGNLSEGPLLDLLIDGVEMAQKLRDSVLWDLLERGPGSGDGLEPADSDTGDSDDDAEDED